jgi:hypothetical protein
MPIADTIPALTLKVALCLLSVAYSFLLLIA